MTQLINQYQVGAFTTPVNGGPQDASVVLGNDNTTRQAHNGHDSDPGVHLQSSNLASRPSAGTVGRKWLTTDTMRLFYDTGTVWAEVAYAPTDNPNFTGFLYLTAARDNAYVASFNNTSSTIPGGVNIQLGSSNGAALDIRDGSGTIKANISSNGNGNFASVGADTVIASTLFQAAGNFQHTGATLKFFSAGTPAGQQTVAGSKGGNAALASLITALVNYGLLLDSTT